ncbi:hypothetical protein [Saccharothrix sp. HUAS TT1]|uniref:hypothetical protein n=1 Tax=unclassified Saccharothrix TaxID=2593673 RepID=UPI00345B98CE
MKAVNVRLHPREDSTRLGILYADEQATAACDTTEGSEYTACGGTNNQWIGVTWNGRQGFVAARCVNWWSQ